jgi:type II secretory pathway pseudopilin PulG
MAIKGKSKGRSARSVTRGPKPVYTPVKKPLLAKREFWLVIAGILGAAIVVGLVVGFVAERNASAEDDLQARMRSTMSQYQGDVDAILSQIGQAQPPSSFNAFTDLTNAVTGLQGTKPGDQVDTGSLQQTAGDAVDKAKSALKAFQDIDVQKLVQDKGFTRDFVLYIINSNGNFVRAMQLYQQAGELLRMAAVAEGQDRVELAARASAITNIATDVFGQAYSDYIEAQAEAGTFTPQTPGLPTPTGAS